MNAKEFQYNDVVINGFVALFVNLAILPLLIVMSFVLFKGSIVLFLLLILFLAAAILMIPGYFSQEPNEARAMVFFGKYKGTFTETGFFWVNPFMNKKKLSLRARNLDIEPIKVNDKIGNPILIGLVLVWKLKDGTMLTDIVESGDENTNTAGEYELLFTTDRMLDVSQVESLQFHTGKDCIFFI